MDFKKLTQLIADLEEELVIEELNAFVAQNPTQEEANAGIEACQAGMALVGELFETGEYFIGDLVFAGEILQQGVDILKPVLGSESQSKMGSMVIGTVQGDLHDIGKNIFISMAEAGGFEVIDLGVDVSPEAFLAKTKELKPDMVGMSGVLTLALDSMKDTVDALKEAGLRDDVKVLIGGSPVTKEACERIGADAFTTNASEGVTICLNWVK